MYQITEVKALRRGQDGSYRQQMNPIEEWCFRYELAILLDEKQARLVVETEGDFVIQNHDYILAEIRKRLGTNHNRYPDDSAIKQYLKNVSKVIASILAHGGDISALDFVPKRKQGRPLKQAKRGKRRPIAVNGKEYESIADAARDKDIRNAGISYQHLQRESLKQLNQDDNAI